MGLTRTARLEESMVKGKLSEIESFVNGIRVGNHLVFPWMLMEVKSLFEWNQEPPELHSDR